jgi:cysteine desulfurase
VRICNNINISIQGVSSERLVIELDAQGICAASQSACRADSDEESYVIAALRTNPSPTLPQGKGVEHSSVEGSIRFTLGRDTTKNDVEKTVGVLVEIVNKIRVFEKSLVQ